jgi:excisionase family DNA binding protein
VNIDLDEALSCVRCRLELLRQSGIRPSPRLIAHYRHLELLAATGCEPETPDTADQPEWITTTEAANVLGCSPQYVRRPTVARSLGGQFVGSSFWIFNRDEVKEYAAQRIKMAE